MSECYNQSVSLENNYIEQKKLPEQFPSQQEIKSIFEMMTQGKEYKEIRLKSNEEGVYLFEIEVTLENGEKREYNYQKATYNYRDTTLPLNAQFSASIHVINYDSDGIPYGGECVANYRDGKWKYPSTV